MGSLSTVWGAVEGSAQVSIGVAASWPTVPVGATSIGVTVTTYFRAVYGMYDTSNSSSYTCNGVTYTKGTINIGSSSSYFTGTMTLASYTYTVPISQTASTTVSLSSVITGINVATDGNLSVATSFTIPASGVPYSHPTISIGASNFGSETQTFSFVTTGGSSYTINSIKVQVFTERLTYTTLANDGSNLEWTKTSYSTSGSTRYIGLVKSTETSRIINYWQNSRKEITCIHLIVRTTAGSSVKDHTVPLLLPGIRDFYKFSGFSVTRGPEVGPDYTTTSPQSCTASVTATTSSNPFYQYGVWPAAIVIRMYRGTTYMGDATLGGSGISARTYTYSDPTEVSTSSSQEYTTRMYLGTTDTTWSLSYTVPITAYNFIALRKGATSVDNRVGILTADPTATLDVNGALAVGGNLDVNGALAVGGNLDVDGSLVVKEKNVLCHMMSSTVHLAANGGSGTGWVYAGVSKVLGAVKGGDLVDISCGARVNTSDNSTAIVITNGAVSGTPPSFTNEIVMVTAANTRSLSYLWIAPSDYSDVRVYVYAHRPSSSFVMGDTADEKYTFLSILWMRLSS